MQYFKNEKLLAALLPSLGLLFGHIFMWSNNVHMFAHDALAISIAVCLCVALVLLIINYIVFANLANALHSKIADFIFYALVSVQFVFFAFSMFKYIDLTNRNKIWSPLLALLVTTLLYKHKGRYLCVAFATMTIFLTVVLGYNIVVDKPSETEQAGVDIPVPVLTDTANIPAISLKTKPNIYLFWLESYQDFEILEKNFGINNLQFQEYLKENGFVVKKTTYSSASTTLTAMYQLYTCGLDKTRYQAKGNADARKVVRQTIGGSPNNFVFRTCKENGYSTVLLTYPDYQYATDRKYTYLDDLDFDPQDMNSYFYPLIAINYYQAKMMHIFSALKLSASPYKGDRLDRIKLAMERNPAPRIIAFYGGADHTAAHQYALPEAQLALSKAQYKYLVLRSDKECQEIMDYIIAHDPNSIIVLTGDHGMGMFRYKSSFGDDQKVFYDSLFASGYKPGDVFDDIYRVFFAYRLPGGAQEDLGGGMYMNNINVFMHIFAKLAQNPEILKYRRRSESELGSRKLIEGTFAD